MKKRFLYLLLTAVFTLQFVTAVPALAASISDYPVYYSNYNAAGVQNDPEYYPDFTVGSKDLLVQAVTTYHWNYGKGSKPGTISIYDWDDQLVGRWNATGRKDPNAQNINWDVFPNVTLKAGEKYYIVDSDTSTWSWNSESENKGFVEIRGTVKNSGSTATTRQGTLTYRSIKINIDGGLITPVDVNGAAVDPFIYNDSTYLPVRAVSGALGLNVGWDDATSTITLTSGASKTRVPGSGSTRNGTVSATLTWRGIRIVLDGRVITPKDVNGNPVDPFIYNGTTYLPVRALAGALGCDVDWDGNTSTVFIVSEGSAVTPPPAPNPQISVDKTVYEPGESITVHYSGITAEMEKNQSWICVAGASSPSNDYLDWKYVSEGSGDVTLKAPPSAGSYQIRFYQGYSANDTNLVSGLTKSVTVSVPENTVKLPNDFSTHMDICNEWDGKGEEGRSHPDSFVTVKGKNIEIELDRVSYTWHRETSGDNPFDPNLIIGGDGEFRRDAVTINGEIQYANAGVDKEGQAYMRYDGKITSFNAYNWYSMADTYIGGDDGASTAALIRPTADHPGSYFTLVEYEDTHRQVYIRLDADYSGQTSSTTYGKTTITPLMTAPLQAMVFKLGERGHYIDVDPSILDGDPAFY